MSLDPHKFFSVSESNGAHPYDLVFRGTSDLTQSSVDHKLVETIARSNLKYRDIPYFLDYHLENSPDSNREEFFGHLEQVMRDNSDYLRVYEVDFKIQSWMNRRRTSRPMVSSLTYDQKASKFEDLFYDSTLPDKLDQILKDREYVNKNNQWNGTATLLSSLITALNNLQLFKQPIYARNRTVYARAFISHYDNGKLKEDTVRREPTDSTTIIEFKKLLTHLKK